jgi:hypothetical protein
MTEKYVTQNGRLTADGDKLLEDIHHNLRVLYCRLGAVEQCSEQEIATVTSLLHKMVSDIHSDERCVRQYVQKSFAQDEQNKKV